MLLLCISLLANRCKPKSDLWALELHRMSAFISLVPYFKVHNWPDTSSWCLLGPLRWSKSLKYCLRDNSYICSSVYFKLYWHPTQCEIDFPWAICNLRPRVFCESSSAQLVLPAVLICLFCTLPSNALCITFVTYCLS